jgi:uncharacterized protein DUF4340
MTTPARILTPLVVVVLAAGALSYAYFIDRGTISDADRESRMIEVFRTFQIDLVRRVELSHGSETLVLERAEGPEAPWTITSPRKEPADPSAVDALLRELELARRVRTVTSGTEIGEIRMRGQVVVGRVKYAFVLGADAPAPRGGAYMTLLGEPAFVIEPSLKVQLLRTADAYRVRSLVRYGESAIARVERRGGGETLVLERSGQAFRVGGPNGLRASRAAMDRVFGALADARAETFLDDAEADRATAHALRIVTVVPRDPTQPRVELAVGGDCPHEPGEVVVARTGSTRTSACVAKNALAALDTEPVDLVDKALLYARADEVEEVDLRFVSPQGLHVNLARKGAGWHLREPQDRELEPDEADAANTLVVALAGSQALSAEPAGPRVAVRARATFVRTGVGSSEALEISAPDSTGIALARREDDGAILRLPRAIARRFEPHPVALRGRAAWTAPFDPADIVAVDDTCTPEPERIEMAGGRWTMRSPPGEPVDGPYAMDLVETLAHAKVDGWITESDDGTFGLGAGACRVTLTLTPRDTDAEAPTRTIVFGARADGDDYARTLDGPAVFAAQASLRELARHPAIDRGRFRVEAEPGARAVLSHERSKVVLVAEGGTFVRAENAEAGDDPLGAALVEFYARDAIHAGPPSSDEGFEKPTLEIQLTSRASGAAGATRRIVVGARTVDMDDCYFARTSGVDATFAVSARTVDALVTGW